MSSYTFPSSTFPLCPALPSLCFQHLNFLTRIEFLKRLIGRGATAQDVCLSCGQQASSNLPNSLSTCHGYTYLLRILDSAMSSSLILITLADPFPCLRTDTAQELARILDDERVAHVRGTPASGKTTLAYLLHEHYRQQNVPSVILSAWPQGDAHVHTDILVRRAQDAGHTFVTLDTLRNTNVVYIIDQGQMSYQDSGLWLGFIKSRNNRQVGPRVCVFTSYGSPTAIQEKMASRSKKNRAGNFRGSLQASVARLRLCICLPALPCSQQLILFGSTNSRQSPASTFQLSIPRRHL